MNGSAMSPQDISARAEENATTRRRALHAAVGNAFRMLLPLQWLGSCLLCLFQSAWGGGEVFCDRGLNPWIAIGCSTVINAAAFAVARRWSERAYVRYLLGASQVLFYALLLAISAGRFDTGPYLFLALGFLTFYRDWRLLAAVAGASLAAQYVYSTLGCPAPALVTVEASYRLAAFGAWALVACVALALMCHQGNVLFRNIGRHQARIELEREDQLRQVLEHEINTPVQFVNDNCYFLRDAVAQVGALLRTYQEVFAAAAGEQLSLEEARAQLEAAERDADLSFLSENMPTAVERSLEGLERVAAIVRSMKKFSHPNHTSMSSADLAA